MPDSTAATEAAQSNSVKLAELAELHGRTADLGAWIKQGLTVEAATEQVLASYRTAAKPVPSAATPVISGLHNKEQDRPWASFGEQLNAVYAAGNPAASVTDPRLYGAAQGQSQMIPSGGGFTVAPQFAAGIWDKMGQSPSNLLSLTDNYTIEGESLEFVADAETSRATGSRGGGVRGYWINEADQLTKSNTTFRKVRVEPQQLGVLVYATEKLLRNSNIALEQYVSRKAADEINFMVGDAIINGSGVGQPKGLLAAACTISVAKETSQANDTINQINISKMWARMHPNSRANAVWLHNVDVEPQLDALSTTVQNVAATENVGGYANKVFDAERRTLKGRPLVACEFCPTLGDLGDIILADMGGYLTGTRGGIESAMSMHVRFEYAEQAFRFIFEVDGQPWLAAAQTPFKGTNTLSTFVALAAR